MNNINKYLNKHKKDSKFILLSFLFIWFSFSAIAQPTLSIPTATSITNNSATLGGTIDAATGTITRGTVWKAGSAPLITDNALLEGGTTTGVFTDSRTGLPAKSQIFYAPYATDDGGATLGPGASFYTLADEPGGVATFTSGAQTSTTIDLSWTASSGATGYLVYMNTGSTAPTPTLTDGVAPTGSPIATLGAVLTTTINPPLTRNTEYSFAIIPFDWDGAVDATYNYGTPKTLTSIFTLEETPTVTTPTITSINNDGATLGGNITDDGGGAITERGIYWSTSSGVSTGDTKEVGAGTATGVFSDAVSGMGPKDQIFFKAYAKNGSLTDLSGESSFYTLANEPSTTGTLNASNEDNNSIDLDWTDPTNADGYLIYTYTASTAGDPAVVDGALFPGSPKNITNGSTTSTTMSSLLAKTEYSFAIVPYAKGSNNATYNYGPVSKLNSSFTWANQPNTTTGFSVDARAVNSVDVSWNATSGATGYLIYNYAASSASDPSPTPGSLYPGSPMVVGAVTSTTITGLSAETLYSFTIVPFDKGASNTTYNYGGIDQVDSKYTLAAEPLANASFTDSNPSSSSIDLSWTAAVGADGYLIYTDQAATASDPGVVDGSIFPGSPLNISNGSTTSTTISSLDPVTAYSFTIVPYAYDGTHVQTGNYGPISQIDNSVTLCNYPSTQPTSLSVSNENGSSFKLYWTGAPSSDRTLVVIKEGSAVDANPVDGTTYASNLAFESGDQIGTGNYVVSTTKTRSSGSTITNLKPSTTYHVATFAYNNSTKCYNIISTSTITGTTTGPLANSTITNGTGSTTVSSILSSYSTVVFQFTLTDGGVDGLKTYYTGITIREKTGDDEIADWSQIIQSAELSHSINNDTYVASGSDITSNSINFTGISTGHPDMGDLHDGATQTVYLKIILKSDLGGLKSSIDGKYFAFEVSESDFTYQGSNSTFVPASSTHSNADAGTNNEITVVATKIDYTTEPTTSATATIPLAQQPILEARDVNDNVDLDFAETIAVTTPDASLSPNSPLAGFTAGYADFTGSGFNLQSTGSSKLRVTTGSSSFVANSAANIVVSATTTVAQASTGIAPSPLNSDGTNNALLGFSLTTTGSALNFTGATITTSSEPDGKIKNLKLYRSTDNSYATTGDNVLVGGATITTPTASSIVIAGITESINASGDYFFIVGDIESNVSSSVSSNLQLSIANNADISVSTGNTAGSSFSGINYAFNDITAPTAFTVGAVATTGGRVVTNFWNGTNTGVNVSVPIANDATLLNGSVQLQARVDADAFVNIGSSATISSINTNKIVAVSKANIEAIANYGEGKVIEFRAILADLDANSTTGTKSTANLTVDTVAPTVVGGIKVYNNSGQGTGDGNHEVIQFTFNEEISLSHNSVPKFSGVYGNAGFSVDDEAVGEALYLNNGGTNAVDGTLNDTRLIYLESIDNGLDWSVAAATNVQYTPSGTAGTGNLIMDIAGNELGAFITPVSNGDAIKPTLSPDIMTLFPRATSAEKIVFTLTEQLKISSGTAVTGFSTSNGAVDPVLSIYTDNAGLAPYTITLVSSSANTWDNTTKVTYTPGGNILDVADNEIDAINNHAVVLETDPPFITSVSIPNVSMKVGDVVPVTIQVNDDDLDFPVLTSGTIGGYTLSNLQRTNSTTYTAQFTVTEGGNSYAAGDNIPVANLILTDVASNSSATYSTPISQGSDLLDATSPKVTSILTASSTNGWSTSNGTSASSVVYAVTFSEPVTGVDASDFNVSETGSLSGTAVVNATITGGPTVYNVTVDSYSNAGTLKLNFKDDGSVFDLSVGNPIVGSGGIPDGSFSTGDTYSIVLPEPTNHVSGVSISNPTTTTLDISWTENNGSNLPTNYLVIVKKSTASFPATVTDGSPNGLLFLIDDTNINDDDIAWRNVVAGTTSLTFTNLLSGTAYDVRVYPYALAADNSNDNIDFKNDGTIPNGSGSTTTAAVSTLAFTNTNSIISSLTTALNGAVGPQVNAISNFEFTIKDDGTNEGDDNTSMTISQFVITAGAGNSITDNWSTVIEGAELSAFDADDATIDTHIGIINSNNITFSGVSNADNDLGQIDDNESKTYILKIWLKNPMPGGQDNKDFVFEINANSGITITDPNTSSQFAAGQKANSVDGKNVIQITATDLAWATQPQAAIGVEATFTTAPIIEAIDVNGNRDLDYVGTVTSISNTGSIGMNNNPDASGLGLSFSTGTYTFDNSAATGFNYQDAGNGTLVITSGALNASPASNTVTVSYSDKTTITAGVDPEPSTLSSLYIDLANPADYVFDIDITDDAAGVTVDDKVATRINQLVFNAATLGGSELETNWSDVIENASIFDGSNLHHISTGPIFPGSIGGSIGTNTLTFSGLPNASNGDIGYIADDAVKNYKLYVWLKNPVAATQANTIDGKHFNFSIEGTDITTELGSSTPNLASPSITSGNTNNVIEVIATELQYETQPSETFINEVMSTVAIEATDANGNRDLDYSAAVTVTSSGTMSPVSVAANLVSGIGNTANIVHTALGTGLTLNAKDDLATFSATGYNSSAFNIIPGAAESDITTSAISYQSNIDYSTQTTTPVSAANNPKMFQFDINDGTSGGSATDLDGLPTNVISLSFDIINSGNLNTVGLFDNSDALIQEVSASPTITFNLAGSPLVIPDDGISTYHLRATFNTTVTDNDQISFTVSSAITNDQGSAFESTNGVRTSGTVATSSVAGNDNRIEVMATALNYTTPHPVGVSIDTPYGLLGVNNPVLEAQDGNNNLDADFDLAISFSNFSASLAGSLTTTPSTVTGNFVGGVYTYDTNFEFDQPSLGNTDVIITIATAAGNNSDGDSYPALSKDTPGFEVSAAESSIITLDGGLPNHTTFNYIDFDAPVGNFPGNAYDVLANFLILDEDLVPGFTSPPESNDLAPTILSGLEINVTNYENIKEIALFDGSNFYYGTDVGGGNYTFTGFNITAADIETGGPATGMASFSITASYNSVLQSPTSDDGVELKVSIINTISAGGSKFNDSDNTGDNDAGGAITPNATNIFNVEATKFQFAQSPESVEGVDVALNTAPMVQALDANNNLDLDYAGVFTLTSESASLEISNIPNQFTAGQLDLATLRYASTGYGTLTIAGSLITAVSGTAQSTDVVNTDISIATGGVEPSGTLEISNGNNIAIFGFGATTSTNSINPLFDGFVVNFDQTITDFYTNIRIFRSTDNIFSIASDVVITNFNTPGFTVTPAGNMLTVAGLSETLTNASPIFFFVVLDVDPGAPQLVPITPSMATADINIASNNGSVNSFLLVGNTIDIDDKSAPQILALTPQGENIAASTDLTIDFDEPVFSLDGLVSLYLKDGTFVQDIPLDASVVLPTNTLLFDIPPLLLADDTEYYVTIAAGNDVTNQGIVDEEGNLFEGILSNSTWAFKTADADPPVFLASTPLISLVYTQGFDLKVNTDEPSRVYYMVIEDGSFSGTPPTIEELIRRDITGNPIAVDYTGSFVTHDTIMVTQESKDFYASITGLNNNTDYTVYYTAVDVAENRIPDPAPFITTTTPNTSPAGVIYSNPSVAICSGDFQEITDPIHIMEGVNSDFNSGNGQTLFLSLPSGDYAFKEDMADMPIVEYLPSGDISSQPTIEIVNSGLIKITVDIAGGNSGLDRITIRNLYVKVNPSAASGDFIKITGSMLDVPDGEILAQFSVAPEVPALFDFEGGTNTISNSNSKIALLVDASLEDNGVNSFVGDGVTGDTLYVDVAGLGTHDITLTHTTDYGCISTITKEALIFDNTEVVTGLNANYCSDDFDPSQDEAVLIGNNNNPTEGLNLIGLTIDVAQTDPSINTTGIIDATNAPSSWALNFDNAGLGQIVFIAQFQDRSDASISFRTQFVNIAEPPTLSLEITGNDILGDGTNYCEDSGFISIFGKILNQNNAFDYTQSFGFDFDKNGIIDNNTGLIDNGDGTGQIDLTEVAENNPDFLTFSDYGIEFDLLYTVNNLTTTCDSTKIAKVIINSKPVANYTTIVGCADREVAFDNLSTNSGSLDVLSYTWNFDDPDNNTYENNDNIVTFESPVHIFDNAATYNVSLTTTSDKGCESTVTTNAISIGNNPETSFNFSQVAIGTPTELTNTTPSNGTDTNVDSLAWTVNGIVMDGYNISNPAFSEPYYHTFSTAGEQAIVLTTITDNNCNTSDTLRFFTVPEFTLDESTTYEENFDGPSNAADQGGWISWGNNSSWNVGNSGGTVIAPTDNNNFWVTGVNAPHNGDEDSYVYSPVFNLTDLERPMIQLSKFSDLNVSNGVVIEYTSSNLFGSSANGIEGDWHLLGSLESGEDWYNKEKISNVGGDPNIARAGWTEADSLWRRGKHILDAPKAAATNNNGRVQFRISFKSGGNNVQNFDGFAFDDVTIGNRTRTVLLENFTSSQLDDGGLTLEQNNLIKGLKAVSTTLSVIQYHTNTNGDEPLSFSPDGDARALYYGISETPRVAIDGTANAELLFSDWGITEYERRSLNIAPLNINSTISSSTAGVEITTKLTALRSIAKNHIVHTVIVSNQIDIEEQPSGESIFNYVALKMIPSASGQKQENTLPIGSEETITTQWSPSKSFDPSEIVIIVFVQDELTKEIYQSEIITPSINIVTALEEELAINKLALYPNPANHIIYLELNKPINKETPVDVYDQLGQKVYSTKLQMGEDKLEIKTTQWTSGLYFIKTEIKGEPILKRIMIQHK